MAPKRKAELAELAEQLTTIGAAGPQQLEEAAACPHRLTTSEASCRPGEIDRCTTCSLCGAAWTETIVPEVPEGEAG